VHGQKISHTATRLLRALPGGEMVELSEATWVLVGSARIYNITRPKIAKTLLENAK